MQPAVPAKEKAPQTKSDEHRFGFLPNRGFVPKGKNLRTAKNPDGSALYTAQKQVL
jgi:hypothetical protein